MHTVLNLINRSIKKVHCSVYLVIILTYFSKYNFHPGNIKYSDYNYCWRLHMWHLRHHSIWFSYSYDVQYSEVLRFNNYIPGYLFLYSAINDTTLWQYFYGTIRNILHICWTTSPNNFAYSKLGEENVYEYFLKTTV